MFRFASKQKNKIPSVIVVCILAIFSVALSKYYNNTQMAKSTNFHMGATNEDRIAFLNDKGIKVDGESAYACDIIVPSSFNAMYQGFEVVQNAQGLSLARHKGEKVRHFSYSVQDAQKGGEKTSAEILVSDGKIIACALCSLTNNMRIIKIIG